MLFKGTSLQLRDKLVLDINVQHRRYTQQFSIINLQFQLAKKIGLNCSYHTQKRNNCMT